MVESKWILILNSGFAPSTHFASMLGCCEQTTFKYLVSACGEKVALCRQTPGQKVWVGVEERVPPPAPPSPAQTHRWHDCNHGRAEGSLRECAPRACARAPALRHLQQPSPACHKNILCNLYNHRKWNKSVLSPTPKNLKLWGLPCSRDLSSWAEHQQKPRTYTDNKRSAFLFLLHLSPF